MAIQNSRTLSEKELLALKKKIEEGKAKIAEAKGKKNYLMSELATKWGCKTIEEAENISNNSIDNALDGLPPLKMHCSNLAADALKDAIADYRKRQASAS